MVLRFLLGAAEASMMPGFSLVTGMWYKREEHPLRHGAWFIGTSLGIMCGGLLAYAIAHIQGRLAPWRWMFIIFAIITFVWALIMLWLLPDTPKNAPWLSEKKRRQAISRIRENRMGLKDNTFKKYQLLEACIEIKVWLIVMFTLSICVCNGALGAVGTRHTLHTISTYRHE